MQKTVSEYVTSSWRTTHRYWMVPPCSESPRLEWCWFKWKSQTNPHSHQNTDVITKPFLEGVWSSPSVKLQYSCALQIHKVWAPNSNWKYPNPKSGFCLCQTRSKPNVNSLGSTLGFMKNGCLNSHKYHEPELRDEIRYSLTVFCISKRRPWSLSG